MMQKVSFNRAKDIKACFSRPTQTGLVPILPTPLHCLFMPDKEQHIFNISHLWEIHRPLNSQFLTEAIYALFIQHDALRLRMVRSEMGWQGHLVPLDTSVPYATIDLSDVPLAQHSVIIEKQVEDLQSTLHLSEGPLLRIVYFNLGETYPGRLLLIVSHYISDGLSIEILLDDLFTAYEQLSHGHKLCLKTPSSSLCDYSHFLQNYASSELLTQEIDYWASSQRKQIRPIPVDYPEKVGLPGERNSVFNGLTKEQTDALLSLSRSNVTIQDILLICLFRTHYHWTKQHLLLVELMHHGRFPISHEINLLRTVGWINNLIPLVLQAEETLCIRQLIPTLKHQIDMIPHWGMGYGVCRYLSGLETQKLFRLLPNPEFALNYLGRSFTSKQGGLNWIQPAKEQIKHNESRLRIDTMKIWLIGSIRDNMLSLRWDYQPHLHRKETIELLASYFLLQLQEFTRFSF